MRIAVAAMGKMVAGHFGHCENFIFFDAENNQITSENSVPILATALDSFQISWLTTVPR